MNTRERLERPMSRPVDTPLGITAQRYSSRGRFKASSLPVYHRICGKGSRRRFQRQTAAARVLHATPLKRARDRAGGRRNSASCAGVS